MCKLFQNLFGRFKGQPAESITSLEDKLRRLAALSLAVALLGFAASNFPDRAHEAAAAEPDDIAGISNEGDAGLGFYVAGGAPSGVAHFTNADVSLR